MNGAADVVARRGRGQPTDAPITQIVAGQTYSIFIVAHNDYGRADLPNQVAQRHIEIGNDCRWKLALFSDPNGATFMSSALCAAGAKRSRFTSLRR